jgi:hypothetical protein
MSRTNLYLSPYRRASAGRNFLVFGSFSALKPSLSHPIPRAFISGISGGFGHLLAFGGMFQKLVSRIDRCHRRSLLGFPVPVGHLECLTRRTTRLLIPFERASCSGDFLHPRPRLPLFPARLELGLRLLQRQGADCPRSYCGLTIREHAPKHGEERS